MSDKRIGGPCQLCGLPNIAHAGGRCPRQDFEMPMRLQVAETEQNLANDRDDATINRLTSEQQVMRQWIAEALPWIQGQQSLYPNRELSALCESGRRLVDGGPDDLLKGVE